MRSQSQAPDKFTGLNTTCQQSVSLAKFTHTQKVIILIICYYIYVKHNLRVLLKLFSYYIKQLDLI